MTADKPSAAVMLCVNKITPYHPRSAKEALSILRLTWSQCSPEAAETAFAIYRAAQFKVTELDTPDVAIAVTKLDGTVPAGPEPAGD
jgi:hypothetical protein